MFTERGSNKFFPERNHGVGAPREVRKSAIFDTWESVTDVNRTQCSFHHLPTERVMTLNAPHITQQLRNEMQRRFGLAKM
jgi:hypothetical protein